MIDGKLNEDVWKQAVVLRDGTQLRVLNLDYPTEDDLERGAIRSYDYIGPTRLPRRNDKTPELPPKKDVMLALLERSSVFIHLDPRHEEVRVPAWFKKQPQLVLPQSFQVYDLPVRREQRISQHRDAVVDELAALRKIERELAERLVFDAACQVPRTAAFELSAHPISGRAADHFALYVAAGHGEALQLICARQQ